MEHFHGRIDRFLFHLGHHFDIFKRFLPFQGSDNAATSLPRAMPRALQLEDLGASACYFDHSVAKT